MKFFLLLFLVSFGPFRYAGGEFSFSNGDFNRWIRPQLNLIVKEYDEVLGYLSSKEIFTLWKSIQNLPSKTLSRKNTIELSEQLNRLHFQFLGSILKYDDKEKHFLSELNSLNNEILKVQGFLDYKLWIEREKNIPLGEAIEGLKTASNLVFFKIFSSNISSQIYLTWKDYIGPLKKIKNGDMSVDYLGKNLNSFNNLWNTFNKKLLKDEARNIPRQVRFLLSTIHRRWNNVLKVALK